MNISWGCRELNPYIVENSAPKLVLLNCRCCLPARRESEPSPVALLVLTDLQDVTLTVREVWKDSNPRPLALTD